MKGNEPDFEELKKRVEAVLFAAGRRMRLSEIAKVVRENEEDVKKAISALIEGYQKSDSPMMILEEGEFYKMTVRERYLGYVKKIVPKTDMSKSVMETLATIAWKAPVLQSEVIRIRTNKAYDHIDQLEEAGFISKKKQGKSYLIMLTQKFYDYFDIEGDAELKKAFKRVDELAKKSGLAEAEKAEMEKVVEKMEVYAEDGKEKEVNVILELPEHKKPEVKLFLTAVENETNEAAKDSEGENPEEKKIIERMLFSENKSADENLERAEVKEEAEQPAHNDEKKSLVEEAAVIKENVKKLSEEAKALGEIGPDEKKKKAKLDLFDGEEEKKDEEDSDPFFSEEEEK
jgi:segregation and condensation protein B